MRRGPRMIDREIEDLRNKFWRATSTTVLAAGLAIAWVVTRYVLIITTAGLIAPAQEGLRSLFAMVFGWGALTLGTIAALQWLSCYLAIYMPGRH